MDAVIGEWVNLILRWLHVVAAMAWIGSSFFFMHLDASLRPAAGIPPGKGGAAWQVHGGGFYEMRKFLVAPAALPEELTWHKWQAYMTWLSGFFLLGWIYYGQSSLYLIDPAVRVISPWLASAIGVGSLLAGWALYDALCKSRLGENAVLLASVVFAAVVLASWGYALVFSGRGALVHAGALMATMMAGNVAMIIIPNQRKVVAALQAGREPDAKYGKQGKQRSTHNNYLTLPVVLLMLANHYPLTQTSWQIPIFVALVTVAGAVIRHFYNVRHQDHAKSPWWCWGVAAACLVAAMLLTAVAAPGGSLLRASAPSPAVTTAGLAQEAVQIVTGRCSMCHAREPVWEGIRVAPKNVLLEDSAGIRRQAEAIRLHAVLTHAMPPGNITEMTLEERQVVAAWLRAGAP
jgi:uncharacterized membrane protein